MARPSSADHRIVAVYEDFVVPVRGALPEMLEVVNAKASGELLLDLESAPGRRRVETLDARGRVVSQDDLRLDAGPRKFAVPPSGLLRITAPAS